MRALKILVGVIFVVIVAFFALASILPSKVNIERSMTTTASQQEIFEILNSFKNFNKRSPWHDIDPDTEYSFSGPDTGVGATMKWASIHSRVGSGVQEITAVDGQNRIDVRLSFDGQDDAKSYYIIEQLGESRRVIWGFDADFSNSYLGAYFGLMMDSMLGPSYEDGLANLKTYLEAG